MSNKNQFKTEQNCLIYSSKGIAANINHACGILLSLAFLKPTINNHKPLEYIPMVPFQTDECKPISTPGGN
jgi:hypothetical protein